MLHRCDKLTRKKKEKKQHRPKALFSSPELYTEGHYLYPSERRGQVAWPKSPKYASGEAGEGVRVSEVVPLLSTN